MALVADLGLEQALDTTTAKRRKRRARQTAFSWCQAAYKAGSRL